MPKQTRRSSSRPNSLGMDDRALSNLLDTMDAQESASEAAAARRDFVRWPFRDASLPMRVTHADGSVTPLMVACRNISRGGMSVVHCGFVHAGSRCTVAVSQPQGPPLVLGGRVARCSFRGHRVHEIGVKFDAPIDVRKVVTPDPFSDCFCLERVKPEALSGTVVYAEDSALDHKIVGHFLRDTGLVLRTAHSAEEAMDLITPDCGLVLAEYNLPDYNGAEFLTMLRQRGVSTPVIVVASDTSTITRRLLAGVEADAFLAKPFTQQLLLRAIAEFLVLRPGEGMLVSTLAPDDPAQPLADAFVASLRQHAARLREAIVRGDAGACRQVCLRLAGTAPAVGFARLGRAAGEAAAALAGDTEFEQSAHLLRTLVAICEQARGRRAA
ncbi:MAG: response regulator [Phycisphaerales bacterium]|nr:response regulator [Phycisphaerales bacterium]